ncbi:MAG: PD40 domain-containing protein [Bacteroidales bacterium]|nr:PD40 domain-containing protein [Bacteroidales bacterium]
MKTLKNRILLLLAAMVMTTGAYAQSKSLAAKADDLFDQNRFIEAVDAYEKAYEKIKDNKAEKNRIYFQIAECYRYTYNYPRAERIYKRLADDEYYKSERKLYFNLAEMCRFQEKFDEAELYYQKYLEMEPKDSYAAKRKQSLIYVNELANNRTRHTVTKKSEWCTDYNDFAPRFVGNDTTKIVFTSARFPEGEGQGKDPWTDQAFSDIYQVFMDRNGQWISTPEPWDKSGKINTNVNEGEPSFTPDGDMVFFSRCDVRENETVRCRIYTSTRAPQTLDNKKKKSTTKKSTTKKSTTKKKGAKNGSGTQDEAAAEETKPGEWTEATYVHLGDTAYTFLYPAISSDGLTLYFSSNMPGGFGEYDLWRATRKSTADDFGRPVNLTSIVNTPGKEIMPVLRNDSLLYFSSDGLPGVGGQDLFYTKLNPNGKWSVPQNLGIPINSSYDEMSIVFYPDESKNNILERGYFSSNRPYDDPHNRSKQNENRSDKTPPINDNIFYFEIPGLNYAIQGTVRDEKSMQLMKDVRIKLVGSDGTTTETRTDKKGFYKFDSTIIRRDVVYKMYLSKQSYYSLEGSESTRGYSTNKTIVHDFRMEPVPRRPIVLPQINFELAKTDIQSQFMDSLMDLYLVMENNPNLVVEIRAHTDCQPYVGLTNDTLSQRRAQSVVDYLVNRGIERERLVAKGYADRVPRALDEDIAINYNGNRYDFSAGTVMECDYIATLSGDRQQAAHSLNRRIEFLVLREDYVSRKLVENMAAEGQASGKSGNGKVVDLVDRPSNDDKPEIQPTIVHDESTIYVTMINSTSGELYCIANGFQIPMLIDERYAEPIAISWEEAMSLLYQQRLTKEDFPLRDKSFDPEGNILDRTTIIFKTMQIGEQRRENVEVVVVKGIDYKFIINRTGLQMFGDYEFDKQRSRLIFLDE